MTKYFLSILFAFVLSYNPSYAQADKIDSLLTKANQLFDNKQYDASDKIYRELKGKFKKDSKLYGAIADQICLIYHQKRKDLRQEKKHKEAIQYLKEALAYYEQEKAYVRPFWEKENRYYIYEELVVNYFALGDFESAKKYQIKIYQLYYKKELPKDNRGYYLIDQFFWEGKLVTGFEYFAKLGDPKNGPSFAKIVYEIAEVDEKNYPTKRVFELQVLGIHKRNPNDPNVPDYYLSKLIPEPTQEMSGPIQEFSYDRIIDYAKLKKDIDKVLKGDYKKKMKSK